MKYTFDVELTDTFAGEANYCWARREKIAVVLDLQSEAIAQQRAIVRAAKASVGRTGYRANTERVGDGYSVHFTGRCEIMFIMFNDEC